MRPRCRPLLRPTRPRPKRGPLAIAALLGWVLAACSPAQEDRVPTVAVRPGDRLQFILDTLSGPVRVTLQGGDYRLEPVTFVDSTCGNCGDPTEHVRATVGLRVRGEGVELVGTSARQVALHTSSGYGVLFDGCRGCRLAGVTVTGGARDPDARATDAAVVVRDGSVVLEDCWLRDNLGDSAMVHAVVVGIAGVVVREGASATVRRCRIERNSWDGIAAYRSAELAAEDNVIDGVDAARGTGMGGGRGTGIALTWDARGVVRHNLVTRYWKGIGVFGDARADVEENIVEDVLTWGIAYWGGQAGRPTARIRENVVFGTGACGVMVEREDEDAVEPGELVGNVLIRTGTNTRYDSGEPYCDQRPIARHAVPDAFRIEANLVHRARQPGGLPTEPEVDDATLRARAAPLFERLAAHGALSGSRVLGAYRSGS
jgi:hypothetical protein